MTSAHQRIELTRDHARRTAALAVPGAYWSRDTGAYVLDNPDPRAAAAAIALFPDALVRHPELQAIRDRDFGDARPHDFASELDLHLDVGDLGPHQLYPWQDTDGGYLGAVMERDGGAFVGWDRGLGKTTVSAAFIKKYVGPGEKAIVATRNDTKEAVWLKQLTEDPGLLPGADVVVLPNEKKKRERFLDWLANDDGHRHTTRREPLRPLVVIVHYEAIALIAGDKKTGDRTVKGAGDGWKRFGRWKLMIFDEGHRLASYNPNSRSNTQMGKGLSRLRKQVDMAVNLTGSSIMNHAEDLFGQLHYLFPTIYRAKWADWNDRFIDYVDDGHRKVPIGFKHDRLPELRRELGVFMVYRRKDEVFKDLPPIIHQQVELDLLPEQRRAYDDMRDQFWAKLEEGGIKAANPLAQMNMLRRIATGIEGLPSSKLDYVLAELEAEPDEQWAIFTWFKDPGHWLAERLGDQVALVDGDRTHKQRREALEAHRKGQKRVLIGSIATIGESLNLQYMSRAIRLDRDWNPQVNAQTVDRLHRNGQQERVYFLDLWAKDTVDMLSVKPNLASKESLRKAVFG